MRRSSTPRINYLNRMYQLYLKNGDLTPEDIYDGEVAVYPKTSGFLAKSIPALRKFVGKTLKLPPPSVCDLVGRPPGAKRQKNHTDACWTYLVAFLYLTPCLPVQVLDYKGGSINRMEVDEMQTWLEDKFALGKSNSRTYLQPEIRVE